MVEFLKAEEKAKALVDELSRKNFTAEEIEETLMELSGKGAVRRPSRSIFKALIDLGMPAIPSLIGVLKNENCTLRQAAAESLDRIGWIPDRGESGATYWVAKRNWDLCVAIGAPAVLPVIEALKNDSSSIRWDAAEALGRIGDARAVPSLKNALKDENSSVRRAVIEALGKIGAPAVLPLIDALENGDDDARWTAAKVLGKIGGTQAVPALINALRKSSVCRAAAKALDNIGWSPDGGEVSAIYWIAKKKLDHCVRIGTPAVLPLVDALRNDDDDVRCAAAEALGKLADVRAVPPLVQVLKDEASNVRRASAEALGKLGDARAVTPLKASLMDSNYGVHRAIGKAIKLLEKVK